MRTSCPGKRYLEDFIHRMASTYTKLHYHIVFSTRYRKPWIENDWDSRLHGFLNGCLRHAGCHPLEIGGYVEHVHILTGLRATHRISDVVCDIKSGSSRWIHESIGLKEFAWQEGYGAFTASAREVNDLRQYIRQQEEHHRKMDFLEEFCGFLDEAGIEWDPRYMS